MASGVCSKLLHHRPQRRSVICAETYKTTLVHFIDFDFFFDFDQTAYYKGGDD